jgi:hypothetical protein
MFFERSNKCWGQKRTGEENPRPLVDVFLFGYCPAIHCFNFGPCEARSSMQSFI